VFGMDNTGRHARAMARAALLALERQELTRTAELLVQELRNNCEHAQRLRSLRSLNRRARRSI
jgi:hypothetical protein